MDRAYGINAAPGLLKLSPHDVPLPSPNGVLPLKAGAFREPSNSLDNLVGKSAHVLVESHSDRQSLLLSVESISEKKNALVKFDGGALARAVEERPDGQVAKIFREKGTSSFILYGRRLKEVLDELGIEVQKNGTVLLSSRHVLDFRKDRKEVRIRSSDEERKTDSPKPRITRGEGSSASATAALGDYIFGSSPTFHPGTGAQIYKGVNVNEKNLYTTVAINGGGGAIEVTGRGGVNHISNNMGKVHLEANGGENHIQNYGGDIQAYNDDGSTHLVNNGAYVSNVNIGGETHLRFKGKSSSLTIENVEGLVDISGTSEGASFFVHNHGQTRLASSGFTGIAVVENTKGHVDVETRGGGGYLEAVNEGGELSFSGSLPAARVTIRNREGAVDISSTGEGGESADLANGSGLMEIRNNGRFESLTIDKEKGSLLLENHGAAGKITITASSPETRVSTSFSRGNVDIENTGPSLVVHSRTRGDLKAVNGGSLHLSTRLGAGNISVVNGKGKLRVELGTGNGDVSLENASPRKLDVEIGSRRSAVELSVGEKGELALRSPGQFRMKLVKEGTPLTVEHGGDGSLDIRNPSKLSSLVVNGGVGDVEVTGDGVSVPAGARVVFSRGNRGTAVEITPEA